MKKQIARFAVVGILAFLVHFSTVALIVPLGIKPLLANVIGFLVAFLVSYSGHRNWTFPADFPSHHQSMMRFFTVALLAFFLNEAMYWALLSMTPLDFRIALFIVLTVVSSVTFMLSKYWAFLNA